MMQMKQEMRREMQQLQQDVRREIRQEMMELQQDVRRELQQQMKGMQLSQQQILATLREIQPAAPSVAQVDAQLDADRALTLEEDALRECSRLDREVRPPHRRMEIGAGRAPAPAIAARHLVGADDLLLVAVDVVGDRIARLPAGLDPTEAAASTVGTAFGSTGTVVGAAVGTGVVGGADVAAAVIRAAPVSMSRATTEEAYFSKPLERSAPQ